MCRRLTKDEHILKFKDVFLNDYDYSLFLSMKGRITTTTKIPIKCAKHGVFTKVIAKLRMGKGCPKCAYIQSGLNRRGVDTWGKQVEDLKVQHNNYYSYPTNTNKAPSVYQHIDIVCPKHGIFKQQLRAHAKGRGCPKCGVEKMAASRKLPKKLHVSQFNKIHNNKYTYEEFLLIKARPNTKQPIPIRCIKHGIFCKSINAHKSGEGCPTCSKEDTQSKGERMVAHFLGSINVGFEQEYKFKSLGRKRFDFYLPNHNTVIEYHGQQHYEPVDFFGGAKNFKKQQASDRIKKEFCESNNIQYIEIPYTMTDKQVEDTIKALLK